MSEYLVRPGTLLLPDGLQANDEVVALRRVNSKTYDLGGGRFKVASVLGAVHYKLDPANDKGEWKDVDLTITDVAGEQRVDKAFYDLKIFTDRVGYHYVSRRGGTITVELVEIDGQPVDNKRFIVRVEGNQLFWDDVADGVDMKAQLRPLSAEIFKKLADETAPRRFKWRVTESIDSQANFKKVSSGVDSAKPRAHMLEMLSTVSPVTLETFEFEEEWTGRVAVRHPSTRQKKWTYDAVYPVIIDAFTSENIVADVDDGFEGDWGTDWNYAYTIWYAGRDYFEEAWNNKDGGVRFRTLGVPQGANVTKAELKFNAVALAGAPQAKIYADDVNDAALWANGNLPTGIAKTAASTNWSATATGATTIGVTSVVQEIINRPGWSSGNDIRFGVLNQVTTGTTSAQVDVYDYNQGQAGAAVLEVTYEVVGGHMTLWGRYWGP